MRAYVYRLATLLTCLFLLTSCWSSKELNEIAIATAIAIDKSDEGYLLTVQIINPGEIASDSPTNRTATTTYRSSGETLFEAFRRLTVQAPRKVYFSHVQMIVFGEEAAKSGIVQSLDFLSRDHEMRTDFLLVIAKDTRAGQLLNILTPMDKISSSKIVSSLKMSEQNWAPTYAVKLDELLNKLSNEGIEAVLTAIVVNGDPNVGKNSKNLEKTEPSTTIQIAHIGVFKGDKLIGWLNEDESKGFNYFINNVTSTIVNVPCSQKNASIEIISAKLSIEGHMEKNVPHIEATVRVDGNVGDLECNVDLTNPRTIRMFEAMVEKDIQSKMESAVSASQDKFNSDILGFGALIHREHPDQWRMLKNHWNEEFKNVEVDYTIHATIQRTGNITDSVQRKDGE
ncbi:Ger(x)C family spore germination protein [Guptibacillus hwajinpoensis]|uniref:Ger(x)C family spore germination protein n=1 Tax=Guptibacillus hwajinpoensis TaxID=208199 RepID=UPI0024B34B64|nr:Ger(x)C family spore germination protein [Pseudalkalibacillus hwajinpoensis]